MIKRLSPGLRNRREEAEMSDKKEPAHEEHLDAWGRMRRDAIKDYGSAASRAMWAGGTWNKVKSAFAGAGEAAAELAPHTAAGVAFELGTLAVGAGVTKLAKVMKVGQLFESVGEARLAGKVLNLGRTMFKDAGHLDLAQSLGKRFGSRVALSAAEAATKMVHAGSSLKHSVPQIVKYGPPAGAELKSLFMDKPAVKPSVIRLQPKPVVEQGVAYKNGVVHFPKSRQFILPPVVVTSHIQKHTRAASPKSITKPAAPRSSIPRFQLKLSKPVPSIHHRGFGLHTPKLHISPSLSAAVKAQKIIRPPVRMPTPMKLHMPRLGSSMHRPAFSPMRPPAMRGFRR
jgi:hypothetical protein